MAIDDDKKQQPSNGNARQACRLGWQQPDLGCAGCCLWQGLSPQQAAQPALQSWLRSITLQDFPKGARLYQEGEKGDAVFSLRTGVVKLVHFLPSGKERIVRLLGKGDLVGLETLCHDTCRHTAISMEPVKACRIDLIAMAALACQKDLQDVLLKRLELRLNAADEWIMDLSTGPLEARTAHLLALLHHTEESSDTTSVKLPHREEMAAMLGVATESLCRILGKFQREGLLRHLNGPCFAVDWASLDKITRASPPHNKME